MRLICANCGAQYEISDTAIPPQGREVQCAACGHGWFQAREDAAPAALPRRPVDADVLNVLREEAAREAEARRSPNRQSETPPATVEPAVPEAASPVPPAAAAPVQPQTTAQRDTAAAPPAKSAHPVAAPARPRNWEPAPGPVDMPVNQALEDFANEEEGEQGRRRFRIGFACGLLLVACLVALYIVGPGLAGDMPALAPYIATYVENVDAARSWIRDLAAPVIGALQG
ncbi:hypothetical protein CDV50_08410 [Haematobacter massiliensis]|nr:zinc-ribbon domain-containing protein [Haematobacter massiliensis]OWJ71828.1 hypothetical protein CDV50_08410 [Haematobacter massiliensis]QBJ23955.1 hypothetical protein HmaOT1_06615 [Haematobacter massiliensis]